MVLVLARQTTRKAIAQPSPTWHALLLVAAAAAAVAGLPSAGIAPVMNTNAMEQMTKYYWGMLGARAAAGATTTGLRSWPPPAHGSGGEPSWEEQAFARDAAGHLGGCVWPPRSYTCTFCRREFRSAQALGGHMNVHRRDRARLRQCASPDRDVVQDAQQQQPVAPPEEYRHQLPLLQLQESPLFMAKAVLISGPKSTCDDQTYYKEEAVISTTTTTTTSPPSYISTIFKESKNKVVISTPAATAGCKEAVERDEEEEEIVAERRKRRRVDQPPEAMLPFFLQLPASSERVEQDAKVPKVITSPSSNSLHLAGRQEVDLELRLGSSPN